MPETARRAERSLFGLLLLAFSVALGILLVFVSGSVFLGLGYSVRDWTARKGRSLQETLLPLVRDTYRAAGALDAEAIARAVSPYLSPSVYVVVYDTSGTLVYGYRQGERLDGRPGWQGGRNFLARHAGEIEPVELVYQGTSIGWLGAGTLGFTDDAENRRLLRTVTVAGIGGAAVSFLLAFWFAYVFSRRVSRQASELASGLVALAGGSRNVLFPGAGTRELAQIASSAEALQDRLRKEEELRTQWASDVSHDLRTPVAAVKSQVEAMMDGVLPATPERLAAALGELGRVEALVNDLGELARIESPEIKLRPIQMRAEDFVDELEARFALEAEKRGIAVTFSSSRIDLTADEPLLLRAVTNVVQNALQYTESGGSVIVRVGQEMGDAVIAVENTGSIPEAEIGRVFDRLYRGEHSRHARGSGLGLTIAKAIIDLHGGRIEIQNTAAGAVRVSMRVPLRPSPSSSVGRA